MGSGCRPGRMSFRNCCCSSLTEYSANGMQEAREMWGKRDGGDALHLNEKLEGKIYSEEFRNMSVMKS